MNTSSVAVGSEVLCSLIMVGNCYTSLNDFKTNHALLNWVVYRVNYFRSLTFVSAQSSTFTYTREVLRYAIPS